MCVADTLVVGAKRLDGVFEGFEGRKFLFRTRDGKLHRQDRSSVRSLNLDKPREVDLFLSPSRKGEKSQLLGYDRLSFTVRKNGRESRLSGMRVHKIELEVPLFDDAAAGRRQASGPIPALDLSGLKGATMTQGQKTALARYKSARAKYEAFLAESTAMVRQMDGATGAKRDELLNRLRRRKSEEQPVTRALQEAESVLLAAFPPAQAGEGGKPAGDRPRSVAKGDEAKGDRPHTQRGAAELPDAGEDGVLLLDVSGLERIPDLSEAQKAAIKRYKLASGSYRRLAGKTVTVDNQAEIDVALARAATEIKAAQAALLKAFPGLRFE